MEFTAVIPIIRILSAQQAKEFYLDFLGFTLDWEHRFCEDSPLYAQITRASVTLHLSENPEDGIPGSMILLPAHDINALYRELSAKKGRFTLPGIQTLKWGKELNFADPFDNRLRFCQQIGDFCAKD